MSGSTKADTGQSQRTVTPQGVPTQLRQAHQSTMKVPRARKEARTASSKGAHQPRPKRRNTLQPRNIYVCLTPRDRDVGKELEAPAFDAVRGEEDASEAADRVFGLGVVLTAPVQEEVVGSPCLEGVHAGLAREDVLEKEADGLLLHFAEGRVRVRVWTDVRQGEDGAAAVAPPELLFGENESAAGAGGFFRAEGVALEDGLQGVAELGEAPGGVLDGDFAVFLARQVYSL